jgi:hypothetical protein
VERDTAAEGVGVLDYDPLCQCQDQDGLRMRLVSLRQNGAKAIATVENRAGNERSVVVLHLLKTADGWRLADVTTAYQPSLLRRLERPSAR